MWRRGWSIISGGFGDKSAVIIRLHSTTQIWLRALLQRRGEKGLLGTSASSERLSGREEKLWTPTPATCGAVEVKTPKTEK